MNKAAPRLTNSFNSILEDKELMREACGFTKTFPEKPYVSQISGSPSLRRGDTNEGLNNPPGIGCFGNNIG